MDDDEKIASKNVSVEEKSVVQSEDEKDKTQIGMHALGNILGNQRQLSLFTEQIPQEYAHKYGVKLNNTISEFGVELTELQQRVTEGILYGFSKCGYEGNVKSQSKEAYLRKKHGRRPAPTAFDNIDVLPCLRMTQSELLSWSGVNPSSRSAVVAALEALNHLATTQYCFYYNRLAYDEKGNPVRDAEGKFKKESVVAVDTLFTIKEVRHNKNDGKLAYYEVVPSTLFLDQREGYFLLIPYNWREEVRRLVGKSKASVYTFRFLLFLRYQFELKRRSKKEKKPYVVKWSSEDVCIALKMPESVYRRKRARREQILEDAYSVAKQLGYLTDYSRDGAVDVLVLNEDKYYEPRKEERVEEIEHDDNPGLTDQAKQLYDYFLNEKRKTLPNYKPQGGGQVARASINHLRVLLSSQSLDEIKAVIKWGLSKSFWVNRIGTPSKLRKYFNEALAQMAVSGEGINDEQRVAANKEYAKELLKRLIHRGEKPKHVKIEILNKYIEIGSAVGSYQPACIQFADSGFKDQLEGALRKVGAF